MNRTIGLISANYSIPAFGDLTHKRSPASIPFGGRYRLIDFALSNMVNAHIKTVGLVTPYYYRSLIDHIGAGKPWGLDRKDGGLFILPGTVFGFKDENARFLFRDLIHNRSYLERGDGDYVLVSSSSLVCNIDYQPMIAQHELSGHPVTLLYKKTAPGEKFRGLYLTLSDNGQVTDLAPADEGEYLFLESFIIDRTFLLKLMRDYSALGHLDFMAVLEEILPSIRVDSYRFDSYVGLMQNAADYMRVSLDLLQSDVRRELFSRDRQISTKVQDTPPAFYVPGSEVHNAVMTAGSIVEGRVESSVIFRSCRIEKDAEVKNCVLFSGCVVKPGAQLEYVICDKRVTISSEACIKGTPEHPVVLARSETV